MSSKHGKHIHKSKKKLTAQQRKKLKKMRKWQRQIQRQNTQNTTNNGTLSSLQSYPPMNQQNEYVEFLNPKPDITFYHDRLAIFLSGYCKDLSSDVIALIAVINKFGQLYVPIENIFQLEHCRPADFGMYLHEFVAKILGHDMINTFEVKAIKIQDHKDAADIDGYVKSNAQRNDKLVSFWVASMCFDTLITHFWRYNHDQSLEPQLLYYLKFRVLDKMNNYILTSDWIL